ncbi:MAG TPA: type VI secretion system tube protein Hcp [Bryobacteraceae bacterium]
MAYDAFMWLKGGAPEASGETTDKEFKGDKAFEIYSFSFGASNPVSIGSATAGSGAGKVSISSFNIMKKTDSASPALFLNCAKGQHFTEAHVRLRKAGGTALVYLEYDFQEVFVESIQWSGSSGGDDTPTESVSFAFGKVDIKYTPQKEKGDKGTPIPASWDLRTNVST